MAFQRRARTVLDARTTGTGPGEPWRILVLPQPERICLMFRIDALGVHQIGLYKFDEAVGMLTDWLPAGPPADPDPGMDADALIAASERSALVTVTHYAAQGSAETAVSSTDLVFSRNDGRLHVLSRDARSQNELVPGRAEGREDVQDRLVDLLT